jgi:hypothetical protein
MNRLKIIRSETFFDCEQCGGNYGEGVKVYYNDEVILDVPAWANCFNHSEVEDMDILKAVGEHLGFEIAEE